MGSIPGLSSLSDDTLLNRGLVKIVYDILWRIATSVFQSLKMHCHQYELFAIACEYVATMFYLRILGARLAPIVCSFYHLVS